MKYLTFLLIGLLFTSCLTVKRIERNCDLFAKVCLTGKDTTFVTREIETTYRDTIIEYIIKRDTVYKETPVYVEKGIVNSGVSHLEVGFAKSDAWVKSGILKHFLESGDTLLRIRLDNALRNVETLKTRLEKRQNIVTVKENTEFGKFTIKWFWISFFVILILTLIVIFKNKLFKIFK